VTHQEGGAKRAVAPGGRGVQIFKGGKKVDNVVCNIIKIEYLVE